MRRLKLLVLVLLFCYAVKGCGERTGLDYNMKNSIVKIREAMEPLETAGSGEYPACITDYFAFYGLDIENVEHIFGSFESGGERLAGHIFRPAEYKATVIAVHGYFDHCGQLNRLIEYMVSNGYAVAAFDLPGLGLSGGERGAIENFSQYSRALIDFADNVRPQLNGPYHFVGHSTGGAAVLDYLLTNEDSVFERVVLVSPLIHCVGWNQSKLGYNEKIPFVKSVPRIFRKTSSDSAFLDFVKNKDPLQPRTIPLKWVRALHNWNDKIADLPPIKKNIKVFQGTNDTTVDWEFNVKFIQEKFRKAEICIIKDAKHGLFNESVDIRKKVFWEIKRYLEK